MAKLSKRGPDFIDPRLVKAMEHPLRIEILTVLREGPSSPTRIQRQLGTASLNLVAHHIKVLKDLGCIELVETVSRRGAKENIYRPVGQFIISDEVWARVASTTRSPLTANVLRLISDDLARSLGAGKFDELAGMHLSRTPVRLDRQGWSELTSLLSGTLTKVIEIGDRSLERTEAGDEAPMPATIVIMQFPTVEGEQ